MSIALLQTHTQVFTWLGDATNKGYVDLAGNWIPPVADTHTLTSTGSLQPYMQGMTRLTLPEGMRERDAYVWISADDIRSLDEEEKLEPAVTTIKGRTFEIVKKADWTGFGLTVDHYEYLLYKQSPEE